MTRRRSARVRAFQRAILRGALTSTISVAAIGCPGPGVDPDAAASDAALADTLARDGDLVDAPTPDAGPSVCRPIDLEGFVVPAGADPSAVSEGFIDASAERDPSTGRTWLLYSGVVGGPFLMQQFRISQRLAYSDDGGASWCDAGELEPVGPLADDDCPPTTTAPCHLNQEIGNLVHVPFAAPEARWKHFWFLVPAAPGNQYGFAQYLVREAATPQGLADAPVRRLFAGTAYTMAPIRAWMDRHPADVGPIEVLLSSLDPSLADCLAFTEIGTLATADTLYASLVCATRDPATNRVELFSTTDGSLGGWSYRGRLVSSAQAAALHPDAPGYSASELAVGSDGVPRLLVSPVLSSSGGTYAGCDVYRFTDLSTAALEAAPEIFIPPPPGNIHHGMCTYEPSLTTSGVIVAQVFTTTPFLRLLATRVSLPPT